MIQSPSVPPRLFVEKYTNRRFFLFFWPFFLKRGKQRLLLAGWRSDGKQDGGDALELETRISEQSKPETMSQAARDLVREARAALESAARAGQQPPSMGAKFVYSSGQKTLSRFAATIRANSRARIANYRRWPISNYIAHGCSYVAGARTWRVAGSCSSSSPASAFDGPYPPPTRASPCCGTTNWRWDQEYEQYVCGTRKPPHKAHQ